MKNSSKGDLLASPTTKWLVGALGVLVLVAIVVGLTRHSDASDPLLTAAPKIVSTPDHPIVIHTKSPEVYAREMEQAGVPMSQRGMHPVPVVPTQ